MRKIMTQTQLDNALIGAVIDGKVDEVKRLVNEGAQVDVVDCDGWTPLHFAAKQGHGVVAEMLLDTGAKVDAAGKDGWQPLHLAAYNDNMDVVDVLLGHGADPTVAVEEGRAPFTVARTPRGLCSEAETRMVLEKASLEWRESGTLADHIRRQRYLGSLRPKVPSL